MSLDLPPLQIVNNIVKEPNFLQSRPDNNIYYHHYMTNPFLNRVSPPKVSTRSFYGIFFLFIVFQSYKYFNVIEKNCYYREGLVSLNIFLSLKF